MSGKQTIENHTPPGWQDKQGWQSACSGSIGVEATLMGIRRARESWEAWAKVLGLNEGLMHGLRVAISEALGNALEHGARNDEKQKLKMSWQLSPGWLEIAVEDPGLGWRAKEHSNDARLTEGGRGVRLMEHLCEEVEHWSNPKGGHVLKLRKRLPETQLPHGADPSNTELLRLLGDFYSRLALPIPAAKLLLPLLQHVAKRWEGVELELRTHPEYKEAAEGISFYAGGVQCEECAQCLPIEKMTSLLREAGTQMCCPLRLGDRVLGVLKVKHAPVQARELMELLGSCMAMTLEHEKQRGLAEQMREANCALKTAANLQSRQRKTLAKTERMAGVLKIFEKRAAKVAGDVVESATLADGSTAMMIADVMGKGVAAAFLAGIFRAGWHLMTRRQTHPLLLMKELNEFLFDELNGQTMFVTCALLHVDAAGETLSVVNAGHTEIYVQEKNGKMSAVQPSGPPLGLFPQPMYTLETLVEREVERVYMPTDGVYSWGPSSEGLQGAKLREILKERRHKGPEEIWRELQEMRAAAVELQEDDQALMVWEATGGVRGKMAGAEL